MASVNLTDHFLIAMPNMVDPYFARSLTYVCEHNDQGALGLVVNRPIELTLSALLKQVNVTHAQADLERIPVHFGGPVQVDRGFVLHVPVGAWQSTLAVNRDIGLTTSRDILVAVGQGQGPQKLLVTLGYAGWAPGQLENELSQNAWLTVRAEPEIIFDLPSEERLAGAMQLLGVDFANLSDQAGHA